MRRVAIGLASTMLVSSLACSVAEPEVVRPPESRSAPQPIIGGTADNVNEATVALAPSQSNAICSGTIIAVNGSTGYVLTAAHCIKGDPHAGGFPQNPPPPIAYVLQADDYANCFQGGNQALCGAVYPVTNVQVHPAFPTAQIPMTTSITDDFAIITFSGANASTPVVPPASNDGLTVGESLELSGYGLTSYPNGFTTQRRHVDVPVDQLAGLQIGFNSSSGKGSCNGDSGGPAFKIIGGQQQVVGVTSFGDQGCAQYDVYGRVQGAFNDFIAPIIGAQVVQTCDSCTLSALNSGGACFASVTACHADAECDALFTCLSACAANDNACQQTCANAHQTGISLFNAIFECTDCNACAAYCPQTQCGSSSSTTGTGASTGTLTPTSATASGNTSSASGSAGGSQSSGTGGNTGGSGDGTKTVTQCGACATAPDESDAATFGLSAVGALAIAIGARRRKKASH